MEKDYSQGHCSQAYQVICNGVLNCFAIKFSDFATVFVLMKLSLCKYVYLIVCSHSFYIGICVSRIIHVPEYQCINHKMCSCVSFSTEIRPQVMLMQY